MEIIAIMAVTAVLAACTVAGMVGVEETEA